MNWLRQKLRGLALCSALTAGTAFAGAEFTIDDQTKMEIGFWGQGWYQFVEHGKPAGNLNEFMARRVYLYVKGQVTPSFEFFTHIASDRLGQEGLDVPALGLGSGVAFRDLWITYKLNDAVKIQVGRMYVPLTRSFGTTSTKALLTTDLPNLQGGIRGNIFFASKVGRDDGITVWGNPFDGRIQYRYMLSEGVEDGNNPGDSLRSSGRVAINLLEPEKDWFNQGTYLGTKNVLALGFGYDIQRDLTLNGVAGQDNSVWTADVFLDHPVNAGAITVEAAYINIENSTESHNSSQLRAGDDASNYYIQTGYLFSAPAGSGRFQPYVRHEKIDVDGKGATDFASVGANYYIKGHNAKLSLDYTHVDHRYGQRAQDVVTLQITAGL